MRPSAKPMGFTLIEVILAITLASGILVVALYFYQRSAHLRSQLIAESERLAVVRLLMDRITTDVRTFRPQQQAWFSGDSFTLRLVSAGLPEAVIRKANGMVNTDLRRISYGATLSMQGSNSVVTGVFRSEEPFLQLRRLRDTNAPPASPADPPAAAPAAPAVEPLTGEVRFIRFSYWDGVRWSEGWNGFNPPAGISVALGFESMEDGLDDSEYPGDLFRRVISIPTHGAGRAWDAGFDSLMEEGSSGSSGASGASSFPPIAP